MISLLRVLMCLDLAAVGCEWFVPALDRILPLGGSHLAQLGLILIFVMLLVEVQAFRRHRRRARARRARAGTPRPRAPARKRLRAKRPAPSDRVVGADGGT
jgi:hypothetical protein